MIKKKDGDRNFMLVYLVPIFLMMGLAISANFVSGQGEEDVTEDIEYELVQGYFTQISYSGEEDISIELTHQEDNFTYDWSYSNGEWNGDLEYLDEKNTQYSKDEWTLSIAVDHDAPIDDDWIMNIDAQQYGVRVLEADTGLAKSGSLEFMMEPQTSGATGSDSFELVNNGNVPSTFELNYENPNLEAKVEDELVMPGDTASITFEFIYDTSDPKVFNLDKIHIDVYSKGRLDLDADGNVIVGSEIGYSETPTVTVGYEGFERGGNGDYSIQYEESIEVVGNTVHTVTFYLYPEEELFIDLTGENVTFDEDEDVTITGEVEGEKLEFDPTEPLDSEYNEVKIEVTFTADPKEDGSIELSVGAERYQTEVTLTETVDLQENEDPSSEDQDRDQRLYLGALVIAAVIVFFVVRSGFWKKEESKRKDE